LTAALDLFQQRGTSSTTLEDICEVADVSPRTFYSYFPTRAHLYEALGQQAASDFSGWLTELRVDDRPLRTRLPAFFTRIGETLAGMPAYRQLLAELLSARPKGGSGLTRGGVTSIALREIVAESQAAGEITAAHSPDVLADILLGALRLAIDNWSANASYDIAREFTLSGEALIDLLDPLGIPTRTSSTHSMKPRPERSRGTAAR
jgi:AcrR family transcriptional regulator